MNGFEDMNIYDRIAVKAITAYMSVLDKDERNKTIVNIRQDKTEFSKVLKAATKLFRENYEKESKRCAYIKYIGEEYIRYLDTIESEIYINSVPDVVFDRIEEAFTDDKD